MMDTRLRLDYPSEGRTLRRSYVTLTALLQETIISYFHTKVMLQVLRTGVFTQIEKARSVSTRSRDTAP